MAAPLTFDVWFLTADQVYRGVPFQVLAGWVEQGRVSGKDKVRDTVPANSPWVLIANHPILNDYLRKPAVAKAVPVAAVAAAGTAAIEHEELEVPEMDFHKPREAEDDDVDMIPLIDVSLVLLIFFMITSVVSSLSPVDVPAIASGVEFSSEPDAMTVQIDLRDSGEAFFSIRLGETPIEKDNNNLETMPEVRSRLDVLLGKAARPPEVRIACNKKIKHVRVQEVVEVLDEYRRRGLVAVYRAEVNEQPK